MRMDGEEFDEVCEGAYLVALGKHGNMKTNQVSFIIEYLLLSTTKRQVDTFNE